MVETNPTTGEIMPKPPCGLGLFEIENHKVDENGSQVLQNAFGSTLSFMIQTIKTQP